MQFAAAPITVGQKTDKNNPLHDKICSYGVEGACCVMMCSEFICQWVDVYITPQPDRVRVEGNGPLS